MEQTCEETPLKQILTKGRISHSETMRLSYSSDLNDFVFKPKSWLWEEPAIKDYFTILSLLSALCIDKYILLKLYSYTKSTVLYARIGFIYISPH